jgi:hypothetical protein
MTYYKPSDKSRLKVMRKRRVRSLRKKVLQLGELFNLDVILVAQDKSSGECEVLKSVNCGLAVEGIVSLYYKTYREVAH